jgi:hypothetical protein
MTDQQKLADEVQRTMDRLDGKAFVVLVWDGDLWCATTSLDITKQRLEEAAKFWQHEAEQFP